MSKIEPLSDIGSGFSSTTKINSNFDKVETAIQNTISRDGSSPNTMLADLDLNSNQIINLGTPTLDSQAATKSYVDDLIEETQSLITGDAGVTLSQALNRANHTGTQAISTVTGLQTALDAKADTTSLSSYLTTAAAATTYQPLATVLTNTTASFTLADETKLDSIEALADVTDATSVNDAGAIMHSDIVSSGFLGRTAAETYVSRTLTGTANEITITNGDASTGNPVFSMPTALTFTGKTITGGTFSGPTLSGTVAGSPTFSSQIQTTVGLSIATTAPYINYQETDASANETRWRLQPISGDFYLIAYSDDFATSSVPLLVSRTGTTIDKITFAGTELEFNGTTLDINAAMDVSGALTNGSNYTLTNWTSANTDIDGLISGSAFGMILEGAASGHTTVGLRENDGNDGFQIISGYDGVNFWTTDSLYKRLCFEIKATGNAYINGTLDLGHATANTLSASGGVLSIEGVAIPTISSTSTLTNKTLSSPTVSGTVAGTPTISSVWTFSSSPVVPTPSAATDAANKAYVDSVATGLQVKDAAAVATTANITLSGEQTIDGVLTSASRVLVKNQTLSENNGVYVSAAGGWTRATDMNTWTETVGALVSVTGGTTNANKVFASTTASGGTLGTTAITFAEFINTSGLQPLDSDLTAIAALATDTYGRSLLTLASAGALRTSAGLVIGTDVQAYSSVLAATTASFTSADETKLDGIEASADVTDATNVNAAGALMHTDLTTNGILVRTGSETYAARTITAPAAGITITNGDGVAAAPALSLANDLAAVEGLSGTGLAVRTASDTWTNRTLTGTANELTVTNGDGVSGNPIISIPSAVTFTGKTITGGTFSGPTLSGTVAGSPTFSGLVTLSGTNGLTMTGAYSTKFREYTSAESTITTLTGGSTFGAILEGPYIPGSGGHIVVALRENDSSDGFQIISGGGNYSSDTTYDKLVASFLPTGNAYIAGTLDLGAATDTTVSRLSAGQLAIEGVQVVTASNTVTMTNKTLTSPVLTTPTLSGAVYFPSTLDIGNASDTTLSRKSAGILQVEAFQIATAGPKIFRTSQYCVGDGSTNDYTAFNSLHTTASAAGGTIIVDGLIRLSTSMTLTVPIIVEGGGFTMDSTRVLTVNSPFVAGRFQVFHGSGTVTWDGIQKEIYPEWWGVKSTLVSGYSSSSNLTAVNAMHASVTAGTYGVEVHWANKQYVFSGAWTAITRNNMKHIGAGGTTLGTWFFFENTTGNDITFSNCQHPVFESITVWPSTVKKTAGYSVKMDGCFRGRIQNCYFSYGFNAVEISDCTETVVFNCEIRYLLGSRGINYTGTSSVGSYRIYVNNLITNNPWSVVGNPTPANIKGAWAISTAYVSGDIVTANSKVWQCVTAGTSAGAGSGPSATPGATAGDAFTTSVADGTAAWYFVMSNELTWMCQDNYAYSVAIKHSALINGAYALRQIDTAATGSSYPIWFFASGVDTDHTLYGGMVATRGEGVYLSDMWLGSALNGHGVNMASTHRGELSVTNSRIMGNANSGIYLAAPGATITGNQIGKNSSVSSAAHSGVTVAAGVDRFVIGNNMIGGLVGGGTEWQAYGVNIAVGGSDNYTVTNNVCNGNVTGGVSDGGTGVNKTVSGNVV